MRIFQILFFSVLIGSCTSHVEKTGESDFKGTWSNKIVRIQFEGDKVVFHYHGQCIYYYPLNTLGANEVELIWDDNMDCKFDNGTLNSFGLKNIPEKGKPFSRYTSNDSILTVEYYFPEWVEIYSQEVEAGVFTDEYFRIED